MTAANETAAAPLSVEEMRALVAGWCVTSEEEARAIATAACLERATNWILAHERDAGVGVIPALETVGEVLGTDGQAYNAGRAEGRADLCADMRAILDPADAHHWNQDGLLGEVRRLASLGVEPSDSNSRRLEYLCELPDTPKPPLLEPVAAVRLEDGTQVVALEPKDLEVHAFGAEDLDERGMPRWRP